MLIRKCPKCDRDIEYIRKKNFNNAEKRMQVCRLCACKKNNTKEKELLKKYNNVLERNCPKCNKVIEYVNVWNLDSATNKKSLCIRCSSKKGSIKGAETKRRTGNWGIDTKRKNGTLKHTKKTKEKISKTIRKRYNNGEIMPWALGKTKETSIGVLNSSLTRIKNGTLKGDKNPMYGTSYYKKWVEIYGKEIADGMNKELSKKKAQTYDNFLKRYKNPEEANVKYNLYLKKHSSLHYSKISQRLFNEIFELIRNEDNDKNIFYAEHNKEWFLKENSHIIYLDFYYKNKNKAIEFYGDIFHANPKIFKKNDIMPFINRKSIDIWNRDDERIKKINKIGIEVLVIWENDFANNEEKIINKCINFLKK